MQHMRFIFLLLLIFYYIYAQEPSSLTPNNGGTKGGVTVVISGTNLSTITNCTFGSAEVIALYDDTTGTITCNSPPNSAGSVNVSLTDSNSTQYPAGNFIYQDIIGPFDITPATGPLAGNTVVTITGTGFLNSNYLRCQFGNSMVVNAIFVSSSSVRCTAPSGSGSEQVFVSNNNQQFISIGYFLYTEPVQSSYKPASIPVTATIGFLVGVPVGAAVVLLIIIGSVGYCVYKGKKKPVATTKPMHVEDPEDKIYKSSNF